MSLRSIRVLIAEDNPMNQQLIRHLLGSWAIEFDLVDNGAEAVKAIRKKNYSLVLMDIQMPEMDGYTATSVIRNELGMDVPVIAMTAHAMVGEKEKCLQLGMNDYVAKPIKETVLYNMIARHAQHLPANEPAHLVSLDYLHELSGNDPEFEKAILAQFLIQAPRELDQLRTAIEKGEHEQVRRVAHSYKSTVGYVGLAGELHPHLETLEREALNENGTNYDFLYGHVESVSQKAIVEVKRLLP